MPERPDCPTTRQGPGLFHGPRRRPRRSKLAACLSLSLALPFITLVGCDEEPPAPPAAPAPEVNRAQQMAEARARVEALREQHREEMRAAGEATVTRLRRVGDKLEMQFKFTNKGEKALSQAEGAVAFYDDDDTLLKQVSVPFREPIAPGESVTKKGRFPIDKAAEDEVALAKTELKALKVVWLPRLYRFQDGSTMESD